MSKSYHQKVRPLNAREKREKVQRLERELLQMISQARQLPMGEQSEMYYKQIQPKCKEYEVMAGEPFSVLSAVARQGKDDWRVGGTAE